MLNFSQFYLNSRIVIFVFPSTQFAEKPRAASDDEANARIEDKFENVNSPLLNTRHAGFSQCGMYS